MKDKQLALVCSAMVLACLASTRPAVANLTVSGPIVGVRLGYFSLNSGRTCGYVPISTNTATIFFSNGLPLRVGVYAKVSGVGSCAGLTATYVAMSTSPFVIAPLHALTADYLFSLHGRTAAAYGPWVTWSEANTSTATALASAGVKTIFYTNPNREYPGDPLYTSDESTFSHTCAGGRVSSIGGGAPYLMDPHSSDLEALLKSWVAANTSIAHFDAVFDDGADDVFGVSALPCNYSAADWLAATQAQIAGLGYPVIYNSIGALGTSTSVSPSIALNAVSIGGMMENCYDSVFSPHQPWGLQWIVVENTELAMANQHKLFFCYASYQGDAATNVGLRTFLYASFLLTYDPATSALWEYFGTPSGFHVEPESVLVATNPLVPEPTDVSTLNHSGTYVREFATCYLAGASVGACAVAVNPDKIRYHPFPLSGYTHTLVLTGGGILDGGTVATTGPAPPATMNPLTAVVVFR
jgi:hypothetical protein